MTNINPEQKLYLESVFKIAYDRKDIRGSVNILVSEEDKQTRTDFENSTAEALARQYLLRALHTKRMRDQLWDGLRDQLKDFVIEFDPEAFPNLSRALWRMSDGDTRTNLDWPLIERAYNLYRNAPGIALGFDPVAAVFGEIGPDGAYNIDTFNGEEPSNCEEAADGSYGENALGKVSDVTLAGVLDNPKKSLEEAMDMRNEKLFWTIIKTLFYVMAELFFTTLADFFNQWRKMPIVKKLIKKIVKSLRKLAAFFKCMYENVGVSTGDCWNTAEDQYPPTDDDEEEEGDDTDYKEVGDVLAGLMKDNLNSNAGLDCIQAASEIMNFIRSRSTSAVLAAATSADENIPDWNTVLMALAMMYTDGVLASSSQALLEGSDFGEPDTVIEDSDITVGDATTELSQDNQRNPLYRVRYYGSTKTRWTQMTD